MLSIYHLTYRMNLKRLDIYSVKSHLVAKTMLIVLNYWHLFSVAVTITALYICKLLWPSLYDDHALGRTVSINSNPVFSLQKLKTIFRACMPLLYLSYCQI